MPMAFVKAEHGEACVCCARVCAPSLHHEGIIDRDADDLVYAFCVELVFGADEAGHMCRVAGGGIGTRDCEDDDLSACGFFGDGHWCRAFVAQMDKSGFGEAITY
jgi:hypothetical protein